MNTKRRNRKDLGFTQVELLLALGIGIILLGLAVFPFFLSQIKSYTVQDETAKMQQRARTAQDFIVRSIQQAGAGKLTAAAMRGTPIVGGGDMYIAVQYDEPEVGTPGRISAEEVVLFALSNPEGTANKTINIKASFDQDGDGTVEEITEDFDWEVPLVLRGPPYNLYRITPNPSDPSGEPVRELVATHVDNLVIKFYDADGKQVPSEDTGEPSPMPYELEEADLARVKTVQIDLVLASEKPDDKYSQNFELENNSVGTYDTDGNPQTGTPYTLSNQTAYVASGALPNQFRRRNYTTITSIRNITTNECGTIELSGNTGPTCPFGSDITATVLNGVGEPVADGTPVEFAIQSSPVGPTLTTTSTTTSGGTATTTINYNGTIATYFVQATATLACGALDESIRIDFLEGPPKKVVVSPYTSSGATPAYVAGFNLQNPADQPFSSFATCRNDSYIFIAKTYDECGNEVAPDDNDPLIFRAVTGTPAGEQQLGTIASSTAEAGPWTAEAATVNYDSKTRNLFRVSPPAERIAVTAPDAAPTTGAYAILIRPQDPLPAWVSTGGTGEGVWREGEVAPMGAPFEIVVNGIPLYPWPPSALVTDPPLLDGINGQDPGDCLPSAVFTKEFEVWDCKSDPDSGTPGNKIHKLDLPNTATARKVVASIAPPADLDPGLTGDIGINGDWTEVPVTSTKDITQADADGIFRLDYKKDTFCSVFSPFSYPDDPAKPVITLTPIGFVTNDGATTSPDLFPCGTCDLVATDSVTVCEKYATVTFGGCIPTNVRLTIEGGVNPFWVDSVTHLPFNGVTQGVKSNVYTGATLPDGTLSAVLSIGDTPSNQTLTVKVSSPTFRADGVTPTWTCESTASIAVENRCKNFQVYFKSSTGNQEVLKDGAYCAQQLGKLYFKLEHCRGEDGELPYKLPDPLTVIIRDQYGQTFDSEKIHLFALPAANPPYQFFEGIAEVLPNSSVQGQFDNGKLEYPRGKGSTMVVDVPWTNPYDDTDVCPSGLWSTTLIPPLPLCFPNAITSGGGASWNGNFKVHWGDVVVRGQVTVPTANKRIAKSTTGQYDGSAFGGTGNSDRLFDLYVGKANTTSLDDGLIQGVRPPDGFTGVYQPYKADGFGNYFTNISNSRINEMIVQLNYDLMRGLALNHSNNSYWCAIPTTLGSLYNPKTKVTTTLSALLQFPNPNNNGDFMFLDSWCKAGPGGTGPLWVANTALNDAAINATPMTKPAGKTVLDALPRWSVSGGFYTKGILYIAGSLDFGGLGSTTAVVVKAPPNKDLHYNHNTAAFNENDLPIRPDPTATRSSFTLGVHVNGAIYVDGEFAGNGNPSVFGAINSERGYSGSGSPELWYNYNLNLSTSDGNSLCVDCCKISASPRTIDLSPGDTKSITVADFVAPLIFQSSDSAVATVSATGVVTAVGQGDTAIWIVDKNNCSMMIPVRVATQCVGLALTPETVPVDPAVPFRLNSGVEPTVFLQVVDSIGETYPFAAWTWSANPSNVVDIQPVTSGGYSAWATGKTCGTAVVTAVDTLGYCDGNYISVVTVSSALDISTITPLKAEYEVGETVTLTATGGSGPLTWHASENDAVQITAVNASTVTVTFLKPSNPVTIDVSDSLSCVSPGSNFYVRCPTPTLVTDFPFDGSKWGLDSTNGRNLYWKITPSDDHLVDPAIPSTKTDQLNKVNFEITPPAGVIWPPYPLNAAPRDEFLTEFCGLTGGDVCSSNPTDISSWPSGEYTFTGTGVATYTEPLIVAECGATRNASTSIKVNIDNCFIDYADYFTSLTPVWTKSCLDNGCNTDASVRNIISGDILAVTPVNNNASTGPIVVTIDNGLYHTTTSSTFAIEARVSGMTDNDLTPGLTSKAGLVMTTDPTKEKVNSVYFVGVADPNAAWDTPHALTMYYFNGATMSQFNTGVVLTPPYDLKIEKTSTLGNFTFKYKNSSAANWTTAVSLSYGAYPAGLNFYSGLIVDTPDAVTTRAEGWFDYYKQTCY